MNESVVQRTAFTEKDVTSTKGVPSDNAGSFAAPRETAIDEFSDAMATSANIAPIPNITISIQVQDFEGGRSGVVPRVERVNIVEKLQKPSWMGKDTLAKYRSDCAALESGSVSDDGESWIFPETIEVKKWRPIITEDINERDMPKNVKFMTALAFDLEGLAPEDICAKLPSIKMMIHSLYEHCPGDRRFRLIVPLKHGVSLPDYIDLMRNFTTRLGLDLDVLSKRNPYEWHDFPACPGESLPNYVSIQTDGDIFDGLRGARKARVESDQLALQAQQAACAVHDSPGLSTAGGELVEAKAVLAKVMINSLLESAPSEAATLVIAKVAPAAPVPPSPKVVAVAYCFAVSKAKDDDTQSNAQLRDHLARLCRTVKSPDDYLSIREEYCQIALWLNERATWAPSYRPRIQIGGGKRKFTAPETLIQRDRVLIDVHWLHARGERVWPELQWEPLFVTGEPFLFNLAEEFATRIVKNDYRAETILGLTVRQQLQTNTLRGHDVVQAVEQIDHYERAEGKLIPSFLNTIEKVVGRWCETDPRMQKHREKYIAHARARELLQAAGSPKLKEIAELGGLIQGLPALGEKTVGDFLKKLDMRLTKSLPP